MNTCHYCGQPATVHVADFLAANKGKHELHLCDGCAHKHHLFPPGPAPHLNLQALVHLITGSPTAAAAELTCPDCGLQYAAFRADGRLGCPHDYDAFRPALEPLLDRIHRGTRHRGKAPRAEAQRTELTDLRGQLLAAVAAENYEDAAVLRDRIRQKEDPE